LNASNVYFGSTKKSVKTELFNISLTRHHADEKIDFHAHEKPYWCLLVEGSYLEKNLQTEQIHRGEVVYRAANYEHSNTFTTNTGICLNVEVNDEASLRDQNDIALPSAESKRQASLAFYKTLIALKKGVDHDILNVYCYEAMMTHLNQEFKGKPKWIGQVKDYISDNPSAPLTLSELSAEFNLHPNYLVRKFKAVTGEKLSTFLTRVRIENSLQSLVNSKLTLTEIALNNGFYDQSHFIRHFKKWMGHTPKAFQKELLD
jgi:AraC-like DNA-binding protein